jgi:predicted oxidoreductase (fatty acid repression mutant protein)
MEEKLSKKINLKYKQSFTFGDEEKEIIKSVQKEQRSSFNSALRRIVIEFGRERTKRVQEAGII